MASPEALLMLPGPVLITEAGISRFLSWLFVVSLASREFFVSVYWSAA